MDIKVRNLDNSLIKKFDKIAKSKGVSRQVFLKKELEKIGDKQDLRGISIETKGGN